MHPLKYPRSCLFLRGLNSSPPTDMPGFFEIVVLFAVACLAGGMNAVAGGGTILTFPTLLAFGMPSIQANATSTLALLVGIIGSLYGYRNHLAAAKPWLKNFAPASIAGGLLGAWLLTWTNEKFFDQLVPFLILFATVLFLLNDVFRRLAGIEAVAAGKRPHAAGTTAAVILQFGVSVYGGYFGAGIGILMLATIGLLGLHHIHEMNAIKTVLASLINIVAAAYFVFAGLVIWPQAVAMALGATLGYYLGSHMAQKTSQHQVRNIVGIIGVSLSLVFFWREFLAR
ncbi:MAG: sulfite exporter TauE/SafE family protein [Terrimicrobiaceae bacterium]